MFTLRYYKRTVLNLNSIAFLRRYGMERGNKKITFKSRELASELFKKRTEGKMDHNRARDQRTNLVNGADLHIVGSYCQGFRPSVILTTEGKSYLFNCGEGFQRLCYSSKIKLSNLKHVFLTNLSWDCVPGAYGLALTLQDVGSTEFTIHGPDGLEGFFESTRSFMSFNTGIKCRIEAQNIIGDYIDPHVHISPIVIDGPTGIQVGNNASQKVSKRLKRSPKLLSYICSLPDLPGTLDPKKCREFGVPIGPLLGKLKAGCDITLADGTIVRSADVVGAKQLGARILILECPSVNDIDLVINNTTLNELRTFSRDDVFDSVNYVVHLSPEEVTEHPKYLDWMNSFSDECKHFLVLHNEPKRLNFIDSYRLGHLMRKLDDQLFPELWIPEKLTKQIQDEIKENEANPKLEFKTDAEEKDIKIVSTCDLSQVDKVIKVSSLDRYYFRPNRVVESVEQKTAMDVMYRNARTEPNFDECLAEYRQLQDKCLRPRQYEPEVVFLGTGSALPAKYRNTSCIVLNFQAPHNCSIIMDCGEDSYGQICRFYGPDKTKDFLRRLKLIYVSHHHADHHVGLIQILRHRKQVTDEPLTLLIPSGVDILLDYHNQNYEDLSMAYDIFDTKKLKIAPTIAGLDYSSIPVIKDDIRDRTGGLVDDVAIVGVDHCINSCAVVMNFKIGQRSMDTFKVAYSGDARPSRDLIRVGRGCDLLIHEATFDHRGQDDAIEKRHSTSTEAIKLAQLMEAKFTILTHFSQKMPKIPIFTEHFNDKIGVAFDNMAVRCPSHFARLPIMRDILTKVFAESLNQLDSVHAKRTLKQKTIDGMVEMMAKSSRPL